MSGTNALSFETGGDAADFLDRPADQLPVLRPGRRIVFGGGMALARWRMTVIMANASMTSET